MKSICNELNRPALLYYRFVEPPCDLGNAYKGVAPKTLPYCNYFENCHWDIGSAFVNWNTAAIIAAGISVWAVSASSFGLEQAAGNIVELAAAIQLCN